MSINRAEPFPFLAPGHQCLRWSNDNTLAVTLENGIFAVRCGLTAVEKDFTAPKYTMKTSEQIMLPMKIIPVADKVREYDVSVSRSTYQADLLKESSSEFVELMWNRTLSPSIMSGFPGVTYLSCSFSPLGGDMCNRSLLCTLSLDHRTTIYSRGQDKVNWMKIVDLCQLLYEKLDSEDYASVPEQSMAKKENKARKMFQKAKDRSNALGIIAVDWSHLFEDRKNENKFSYVFGSTRSGHLAIWKINFPAIKSSSCSLVDYFDLTTDHPASLKWCQLDDSSGFLTIGYTSGKVRSLVLHQDNNKEELVKGKVVDLWQDEDQISVVDLVWSKESNMLFAAKGPYILAYKVQFKRKTLEIMTVSVQHTVVGSGGFHIHCLNYKHPYLYIEHQESTYKLTVDSSAGFKMELEEVMLEKLEGNWRYEGMTVSPNRVLMIMCSSPSKRYCHLTMRNPIRVTFHALKSLEEICELITKMDYGSLDTVADAWMFVMQQSLADHKIPKQLKDYFCKDEEKLNISSSLKWLKTVLHVYSLEREVIILDKYDETEIKRKIKKMTELITGRYCIESLTKLSEDAKTSCLSVKEKRSAMVMCKWLSLKKEWHNDDISNLINKVQSEIQSTSQDKMSLEEKCPICKNNVIVSDHIKDGCEKKHVFTRCCQTLLQMTTKRTRKCSNCHHLAGELDSDASEFAWLAGTSRLQCTFCDNFVI